MFFIVFDHANACASMHLLVEIHNTQPLFDHLIYILVRISDPHCIQLVCLSAFYIPAASLIGLAFVGCQHEAVLALLCITVGFNGLNYCGFNANHIDIASNFSGTLMGITNMASNFMGFLAPMAVSAIVEGHVSDFFNRF